MDDVFRAMGGDPLLGSASTAKPFLSSYYYHQSGLVILPAGHHNGNSLPDLTQVE